MKEGIKDTALSWIKLYLSNCTQSVLVNGEKSAPADNLYGVSQGYVLTPLLFRLNMLLLATLMESLVFSYHFYVDDTQYFLLFSSSFFATIDILQAGYNKIFDWSSSNFLKLNHNKTEILLIGSPY